MLFFLHWQASMALNMSAFFYAFDQTMLTRASLRFFKLWEKRPPMWTLPSIKHCRKRIKLPNVCNICRAYDSSYLWRIYKVYIGFLSRTSSNEQNDVIGARKPTSIPTEGSKNAYSYSGCVCCLLSSGLCTESNKVNNAVE